MAQSGYTPIQLYRTSTASAVPTAGNLAAGELAINLTDEKLYFKNASGTVTLLASSASASNVGTVTSVAISTGTTGLTVSGSPITSSGTITIGGTLAVANGGTGTSTAFTAGSVVFAGASGVYTQDNANLFWDNANDRLGIGTTSPLARLVVSQSGANGIEFDPSGGYISTYNRNTSAWTKLTTRASAYTFNLNNVTDAVNIDTSGNLGINATPAAWGANYKGIEGYGNASFFVSGNSVNGVTHVGNSFHNGTNWVYTTTGAAARYQVGISTAPHIWGYAASGTGGATVTWVEAGRITYAGYLEATYSDKVVALGNSGTATTIDLTQGNVFTATLTGNCTFTLSGSNANSSRGSSFTLILTNDGTAGRTVAWAGGNFRFPGGAASLSRTTTANAVDIWVFFTPDQGTTWYGNISMKNMTA